MKTSDLSQRQILERIEELEIQTNGLTLLLSEPALYKKKRNELETLNKALQKTYKRIS